MFQSLTDPSSGSAQLYKTTVQPLYHFQHVELSQVRHCMCIEMDMCTVPGAACRSECINELTTVLDTGNDGSFG